MNWRVNQKVNRSRCPPVHRLLFLLVLIGATSICTWASEHHYLYRGARASAMGGAAVGLADDEQTVFYNPAALSDVDQAEFYFLPIFIDLSRDLYSSASSSSNAFSNFGISSVNALMGNNVYGRIQTTPMLVMPNVGVSIIQDNQIALFTRNQAQPDITLGWQTTNGLQVAGGFSVLQGRKRNRKGTVAPDVSVGIAGKLLYRRGGYKKLSLSDLTRANEGTALVKRVAGNFSSGLGMDLGVHTIQPMGKNMSLRMGASWLDIGDITFKSGAETQKQNITLGGALVYDRPLLTATFAWDYSHALDSLEFRRHMHYGLEFAFPVVSVTFGINQVYFTSGVRLNLGAFRLTALTYGEELGTNVFQDGDRRFSLALDFSMTVF